MLLEILVALERSHAIELRCKKAYQLTIFSPLATTIAFMADDDMVGSFHMSLEGLIAVVFFRKDAWEGLLVTISAYYPSTDESR
jgi:hypothetical protein